MTLSPSKRPSETRQRTVTEKVATPFGTLYAHVGFDADGRPCEAGISTPGKRHGTEVHDALIAIGEALTAILKG